MTRQFQFSSKYDQIICPSCTRHQGETLTKLKLRDDDHRGLWTSEFALLREEHEERIANLVAQHEAATAARKQAEDNLRHQLEQAQQNLRQVVAGLPPETVRSWIENSRVSEAETSRDRAYTSRDYALEHLWRLAKLHRDDADQDHHCRCGRRTSGCQEYQAIEPILATLDDWEYKQLDRASLGLPHGLPWDHPELQRLPGRGRW